MRSKRFFIVAAAAAVALICSGAMSPTQARTSSDQNTDEKVRAEHAASVLEEIMGAPDQGIPDALLKKAYGIAVIPHVVKGAFGIGGRYGKGLVAQRNAGGGWGTPLFVEIGRKFRLPARSRGNRPGHGVYKQRRNQAFAQRQAENWR